MAKKDRLFEIFERVTGIPLKEDLTPQEIGNSSWTETTISELLDAIGQDENNMFSLTAGVSNGDWGRVKYFLFVVILFERCLCSQQFFIPSISNSGRGPHGFQFLFKLIIESIRIRIKI